MYVFHEIDEKDLIISPYAPPPHHPQPLLGKEGSILAVPVVRTPLLTKLLYAHIFWSSHFLVPTRRVGTKKNLLE